MGMTATARFALPQHSPILMLQALRRLLESQQRMGDAVDAFRQQLATLEALQSKALANGDDVLAVESIRR